MRLCVVIIVVGVFNNVTKTTSCVLFSMYMHYKSPFLLNIHKLNYSKAVHIDISYIMSVRSHVERQTNDAQHMRRFVKCFRDLLQPFCHNTLPTGNDPQDRASIAASRGNN